MSGKIKKKVTAACQNCRRKKIKCNDDNPCSNCKISGIECKKTQDVADGRKERYKIGYIKELERQVFLLKDFIGKVKKNPKLIENIENVDDIYSIRNSQDDSLIHSPSKFICSSKSTSISIDLKHGLTNFETSDTPFNEPPNGEMATADLYHFDRETHLEECIGQFFDWLQFDHPFIDKKAFFKDYKSYKESEPLVERKYFSEELLYSLAALGAKLSTRLSIVNAGDYYYSIAKKRILLEKISSPSICTVQALLCLSSYDNGYNDKSCWILSGLAFRMLEQLKGLEKNLKTDSEILTWNRFLWGCYIYDHQISLILGRSVSIPTVNVKVHTFQNFSDMDDITLMKQLADITEEVIHNVFLITEDEDQLESKLHLLNEYNIKLIQWKDHLRSTILVVTDNSILTGFKLYYHILVLSLNRPLFTQLKGESFSSLPSSRSICEQSVTDLYYTMNEFKKKYLSFHYSSISVVYASILCLSYLISSNEVREVPLEQKVKQKIDMFLEVLEQCSETWQLSKKALCLIKTRIRSIWSGYCFNSDFSCEDQFVRLDKFSTAENMIFQFGLKTSSNSEDSVLDQLLKLETSWESYFPDIFDNT